MFKTEGTTTDNRPMSGKRILVTRPRAQAGEFVKHLTMLGGIPIEFPTIQIVPPSDNYSSLDASLRQIETFDWVVFTSINGVIHTLSRLEVLGLDISTLGRRRLASIGPGTARALIDRELEPEVVPERHIAEGLLEEIPSQAGHSFLLPRAEVVRDALRVGLQRAGANVTEVTAYRTLPVEPASETLAELDNGVDIITFTSNSTIENFISVLGFEQAYKLASQATVAAIGPVTAATARDLGLHVDIVPDRYTIDGLLRSLVKACQDQYIP
jgi:uroporphyrinogen-III synthase